MSLRGIKSIFFIFVVILIEFCGKIEAASVTCEPQYGFLPCTSDLWGRLFLIVVYQYLMSLGQSYISRGSDKFFSLIGPGIFGASFFHILANFPMLFLILEMGLSSDDRGASFSAAMGMNVLAGSAVMSLTLIWPSVIAFGSCDIVEDDDTILPQHPKGQPSFLKKLTDHGLRTDSETSETAGIMLVSMIPFIILQLPRIINSDSVKQVIVFVTLMLTLGLFAVDVVHQIFRPWIQNRRYDYVMQKFVQNKLLKLLTINGKANMKLIQDLFKKLDTNEDGKISSPELKTLLMGIHVQAYGDVSDELVDRIMEQLDISGDHFIDVEEFCRVMKKWLDDAMKLLSKNDHNPLWFFVKPQEDGDEEQQEALIAKKRKVKAERSIWDYLEALALVVFGTFVAALVALPLIMNVSGFATAANVPSFLIPYFIVPCAINTPRLLGTIASAKQKTHRAASLTLSQIYSGVFTSNISSLASFLLIVYIRDVPWDVTAEVLVVLIICGVMGIFTSTRTVFPLWTAYVVYMLYPISLFMLYLLTTVWGWS